MKLQSLLFTGALLLIIGAFGYWLALGNARSLPDAPSAPAYPNAQATRVLDMSRDIFGWKGISFVTVDSPTQVRSFYEELLAREGWHYDDCADWFFRRDESSGWRQYIKVETTQYIDTETIVRITSGAGMISADCIE